MGPVMQAALARRQHQSTGDEETASDVDGPWATGPGLPRDLTFELLMNARRRLVLRYLEDEPATTLRELAGHVAARENGKPSREVTSTERKRAYIGLYQHHLPKLADAGVIDFDSDRGTVERTSRADRVVSFLEAGSSDEDPARPAAWPYCYLGVALTGGGLLVAQQLLLRTLLAANLVAGAILTVLASLALAHARHESRAAA